MSNVRSQMGSQIAEFKSLWEAEAGKTRLGKQQQKAAEAEHKQHRLTWQSSSDMLHQSFSSWTATKLSL